MLDEIIKREDVSKLLEDICNSARYYDKKSSNSMGYQMYFGVEQILFLFYGALFKYKIIIDDMSYFDEFFDQIDKLIRRIDNFYDISKGINRIIGKICSFKFGIKDTEDKNIKKKLIKYIYNVYFVEGYYIHGYSSRYYRDILEKGFVIENYNNLYTRFIKIQNILNKKGYGSILDKNFSEKKVEFTDSFLLGCYYSVNSPMFFSNLLCRNEFVSEEYSDEYSKNNYNSCLKNLNKVIRGLKLNEFNKRLFINTFKSEWILIDKDNSKISLMLVPRKLFVNSLLDIDKFIEDNIELSYVEMVSRLLSQKNTIVATSDIDKKNITLINLDGYKKYVKEEKKETLKSELERTFITSDDEFAFSNTYGKVSLLLLIGTVLIMLGVILTILKFS